MSNNQIENIITISDDEESSSTASTIDTKNKLLNLNYFKNDEYDDELFKICSKIDKNFSEYSEYVNTYVAYLLINYEYLNGEKNVDNLIDFSFYPGSGEIYRPFEHFSVCKSESSSAVPLIEEFSDATEKTIVFIPFKGICEFLANSLEFCLFKKLSLVKRLENISDISNHLTFLKQQEMVYLIDNILELAIPEFISGTNYFIP